MVGFCLSLEYKSAFKSSSKLAALRNIESAMPEAPLVVDNDNGGSDMSALEKPELGNIFAKQSGGLHHRNFSSFTMLCIACHSSRTFSPHFYTALFLSMALSNFI